MKDLKPDTPVTTPHGSGTVARVKPGNFRKQDYLVELRDGRQRWYAEKDLKLAA